MNYLSRKITAFLDYPVMLASTGLVLSGFVPGLFAGFLMASYAILAWLSS